MNIDFMLVSAIILILVNIYLLRKVSILEEKLFHSYSVLGYYRIRFGFVSREDIDKGVGITKERMDIFLKELSMEEKNNKE